MKGKFFLIFGAVNSGTQDFSSMVHRIFEYAKDNAPAILFFDDSDCTFDSGQERGLYQYLLTMLDGLESKRVGRPCVILTAMDVGNLPPALVGSRRIEVWLAMRYPNKERRAAILRERAAKLPEALRELDIERLVEATEHQFGADLKRIVEEGKTLYAYDVGDSGQSRGDY